MPEAPSTEPLVLPHELMAMRLEQSQQMRDFFIEMWRRNPALALQGGPKVQALIAPLQHVFAEGSAP